MQSKPVSGYIAVGIGLRFLQGIRKGVAVHEKNSVLANMVYFLNRLKHFELTVSHRAAHNLRVFGKKLAKTPPDHKLTGEEAAELGAILKDLTKTLIAETDGNIAFILTDKRIDVNKLLADAPFLLKSGVFYSLPESAQYDFVEGCRCIAFERPTAAAFHLLRGTESLLRQLYRSFVKRNRVKLSWEPMLKHLKSRATKPPAAVLDSLDKIQSSHKNPAKHPEKRYDIDEVQDLLLLCVDALNQMVALL